MVCTTVRPGFDCFFMTKRGCTAPGGACSPTVERCNGCARAYLVDGKTFCSEFPVPSAKWAIGTCNLATHVQKDQQTERRRVNPLKASKKAQAGKW